MKKDKKPIVVGLLDALGEIILTLLFFGIGVFIVSLFGVDFDSPNIDPEVLILLGIVVFFVLLGLVVALVQWFEKRIRRKRK